MKRIILAVLCMVMVGSFGFSQNLTDLNKAEQQARDMLDTLLKVLPNTATQQNIQPKAWIGYLVQVPYPEITQKSGKVKRELPHFTLGPSLGAGIMSADELNDIGQTLTGDDLLPIPLLPWPSVSADVRIGGIKIPPVDLPFDLGFSFMTLDLGSALGDDLGLKWTNWGVDVRYLILRQNGFIPNVSAGVGFAHWSLTLDTTNVDVELSTDTLYFTGQASYTLANFFIPYLGLKMMTGKNKADLTIIADEYKDLASRFGYDNWRTVGAEKSPFQVQIFGGFGFDWLVFQTAIGASIDVTTGVPGLNFSTRLSL
ncbi:MAG: hypothetical protein LBL19_00340 [Spirochaetaceae bacterium]|nr:hypothetical protein [Spirochaetaceae bacterium]